MKRVFIAAALAMSMLFGTSASAGGKSFDIQVDGNFLSIGWNGHHQRGKQYRQPRHWQKRRAAPRRGVRHAPRRIYRQKPIYRPARPVYRPRPIYRAPKRIYRAPRHGFRIQKRIFRHAPHRYKRPAPRHYKRYLPRHHKGQQRRRAKH